MRFSEKPLTTKQRDELQGYIAPLTRVGRALVFIVPVVLTGLILRGAQRAIGLGDGMWWLIPTMVAAFGFSFVVRRWTGGPRLSRCIREDLESGMARVTIVKPASVVEFEEQEDEGLSYLIETVDGDAIFFGGQYLDTYKRRKFPWSEFHLIEAPRSKVLFRIERHGEPLVVKEVRPQLPYHSLKKIGAFNSDYVVLDETSRKLLNSELQ